MQPWYRNSVVAARLSQSRWSVVHKFMKMSEYELHRALADKVLDRMAALLYCGVRHIVVVLSPRPDRSFQIS
jgi:hypothetical protein